MTELSIDLKQTQKELKQKEKKENVLMLDWWGGAGLADLAEDNIQQELETVTSSNVIRLICMISPGLQTAVETWTTWATETF